MTGRLESLDVFRGLTIASMMLVNNPGSSDVYPQLDHADWNGWTFTDTVFPFFLWIVGVAMTLSFAKRRERGDDRRKLMLHVLWRAAVLYAIGLFLAGFPYFHLDRIRLTGVLPRIAVCYLAAAAIFLYTSVRGQLITTAFLLAFYWALMKLVPVPGLGPGHLEKGQNLSAYVDSIVLSGHMWSHTKTWDPEGTLSTLPAIATTLFGVLAGHIVRLRRDLAERACWIFASGAVLLFAGLIMSAWLPINKSIWTSSYAVFMAGLASIEFGVLFWILDGRGWQGWWSRPFAIYGMNAIAVFIAAGLIGRLLGLIHTGGISLQQAIYQTVFAPLASPVNASLLYAIANVIFFYLIAWLMYRRGWFLRF
jgi:predicted acyltransferase